MSRIKTTLRGRTVVAVSGKHAVTLVMRWPAEELTGLLGFAIRRTDNRRRTSWLKTVLRFPGEPVTPGKLEDSAVAPIQSMAWTDYNLTEDKTSPGLDAGTRYVYEVIPVRGQPGALELEEAAAVRVAIATEPERDHGPLEPEVHFNRGLSDMQEYERLFGEGHEPAGDRAALDWLARDLDTVILDYIAEVKDDPSLRMDVAAYHLDSQPVIDALAALGNRLRISLDWGDEEDTTPENTGPNGPAYLKLVAAGATVHQRRKVAISHNKYMLQKRKDGTPIAVLTGSTNFTDGGIASQSNQSVIVRNPDLAKAYLADFELVLKDDNSGLHELNKKLVAVGPTFELSFSPHATGDRPDLDRLTALAKAARSSRLFMCFRMTDPALIEAMLDPSVARFGVCDRVYTGKSDASGDRLLYNAAFEADPGVVACNSPLDDEPDESALLRELKRSGYDPIVHHKILLLDWDQPDCVVVTGSANYSTNSTAHNDENSLIVHGDQRLAEEYFVEMARLFNHWRPRWLQERDRHQGHRAPTLAPDSTWTGGWATGGRLAQFLDVAVGKDAGTGDTASLAAASPATATKGGQRIKHVVVMMLENRSFDQMLGQLPGVDGLRLDGNGQDLERVNFLDPQNPKPEEQIAAQRAVYFGIPEGDIPPPKTANGKVTDLYGGPSHSFPAANQQLYNDAWGPAGSGTKGATPTYGGGYVKSYADELRRTYQDWAKQDPSFKAPDAPPREHLAVVMAGFSPEQLPVLNGLAAEYCVCDRWFSEVPGPTEPNRLFMHAATSLGFVHNPWEYAMDARTIYDDIDEQAGRSWATYYYDLADATNFVGLKSKTDRIRTFDKLAEDLKDPDSFPSYVFLCPRYSDSEDGFANSQHAPYDVRYGEHWIADVYEALRASPVWESTLLVITYDEHGGFYDHVFPPDRDILPPDQRTSPTPYDKTNYGYMFDDQGRPKRQYQFDFDRLGARVPAVLVSPWLAKGTVEHRRLQHTSVLATVRRMWALRRQPLTAREGQAAPFDDLLEVLDAPRTDCPTTLTRPPLPDRSLSAALDQPLSPAQLEVFAQVNHLDGHEDSGKPAPVPKTQREAARYLAERNAAHAALHDTARTAPASAATFEIFEDARGEFRWRLRGSNHKNLASSGEGFETKALAEAEIALVQQVAAAAPAKEITK